MIHYNDWKSIRRVCFLMMAFLSFFIIMKGIYTGNRQNPEIVIEYVILMLSSTVMFTLSFTGNDKNFLFEIATYIYGLKIMIYDIFKRTISFQNGDLIKFIYYVILFLFLMLIAVYIFREISNFNICHNSRKIIILISLFLAVLIFFQIILTVYVANIMQMGDISKNPFFFFKLILSDVIFIPVCVYCALKSEKNNKYALVLTGVVLFLTASGLFVSSVIMLLKVMQYDMSILRMDFQIFSHDILIINGIKVFLNLISFIIIPVYVRTMDISYIKVFK